MKHPTEQWRPVLGYEGLYEVSDHGRVRSVTRVVTRRNGRAHTVTGNLRKQADMPKGHKRVTLVRDGAYKTHTVHSLVLTAFDRPRRDGEVARHLNGTPDDNRIGNLKWGTGSENQYDAVQHGTHYLASKTRCKRGHALEGRNLLRSKNGRRICIACKREHDSSREEGRPFSKDRADDRYHDVLAGVRRHKSEHRP